ncbi:formimidoylglutamate deiminase [Shimia sp. NS0008-38b]|uniref:formimidoylglutamate deiminase n=1 Tax=Shimia sp. NS0008-38b TaxID=3127653 RepID=UPI00334276B5
MQTIWAKQALVADQWANAVTVEIAEDGRIHQVKADTAPTGLQVGALLPSPANLHSHAFQRAMAGLSERQGPSGRDTFWTWRALMFRFLDALTPDDVEAIAAFVQMEMLEAGYASVGEFHYLHHQPDGTSYADIAEMSARIAAATETSGIGLTMLPVLYMQGGCDASALTQGQIRFGNDIDQFEKLYARSAQILGTLPSDTQLGVAPHSLRAVSRESLAAVLELAPSQPVHMHLAEQIAEVDEVVHAYGQRPVDWLLSHHDVTERWCLIHCTQMTGHETVSLARTGAVAGLCPITESSLGDGIFDGRNYLDQNGRFGIGSDSNIRISLSEELRTLEYSQRLRDYGRAILAAETKSTGRNLYSNAVAGGAQALGRASGGIIADNWADLVALDLESVDLEGRTGDAILDSFIFAGDDTLISDVWSAGRHMVHDGKHIRRNAIEHMYRKTMRGLRERI